MPPKYSRWEIERRWLVPREAVPNLARAEAWTLEDKYLECGRLRLRKVAALQAPAVFKLGKKYPRSAEDSGPACAAEPVVSVYLTESEYEALLALPGASIRKTRYRVAGGALDVYEHPAAGLLVFGLEFPDEAAAAAYVPPSFVGREITGDASFSGHAIAHRAG